MPKTGREQCFDALMSVYREGAYSSIVLRNTLMEAGQRVDAKLISSLFYGVLERDITLMQYVKRYAKQPNKIDLAVLVILKMGFYQLFFLDGIPERAAVHETVNLCAYARKTSAKSFVNALLRAALRERKSTADGDDPLAILALERLPSDEAASVRYSCPLWLVRQWENEYGRETTAAMLPKTLGRPPFMVRVNTLKTNVAALTARLQQSGVTVTQSPYLEHCLILSHTGDIEQLPSFVAGEFHVQDLASQWCATLLDAHPGMTVLDLCAAPGSKSFTIAQSMEGRGSLYAFDLHDHKLTLMEQGAKRLGITNLTVQQQDATQHLPSLPMAERVLCDVPCAGLGAIRRKPDIKYKDPQEFASLPSLQGAILANGARYVKPGGKLIYATCSLSEAENEAVATAFLADHADFTIEALPEKLCDRVLSRGNMMTFLPQHMDSDGFFVAVFSRQQPGECDR